MRRIACCCPGGTNESAITPKPVWYPSSGSSGGSGRRVTVQSRIPIWFARARTYFASWLRRWVGVMHPSLAGGLHFFPARQSVLSLEPAALVVRDRLTLLRLKASGLFGVVQGRLVRVGRELHRGRWRRWDGRASPLLVLDQGSSGLLGWSDPLVFRASGGVQLRRGHAGVDRFDPRPDLSETHTCCPGCHLLPLPLREALRVLRRLRELLADLTGDAERGLSVSGSLHRAVLFLADGRNQNHPLASTGLRRPYVGEALLGRGIREASEPEVPSRHTIAELAKVLHELADKLHQILRTTNTIRHTTRTVISTPSTVIPTGPRTGRL